MVKGAVRALHPVDRAVGLNIRRVRRQKKLSQEALAEAIGLTFQQLQKYESGVNRVSCSRLCDIAAALNVTPGDLLPEPDLAGRPTPLRASHQLHQHLLSAFESLTPRQARVLVLMARAMASGRKRP